MARPLSQTLIRNFRSVARDLSASGHLLRSITYPPSARLVGIRCQSDQPKTGHLIEIDLSQGTDTSNADVEVPTTWRLENAIEVFYVHKSAPGWLPFAPGSSYWIPPSSRSQVFSLGIIARPEKSLTKEEVLSHTSRRGWPSLSYFVDGGAEPLSDEE